VTHMSTKDLLRTIKAPGCSARPAVFHSDGPVILHFPVPPSVNNLFHTKANKGRAKTKHYLAWIEEAGWRLREQHPRAVQGWYVMQVELPVNCRADLGNHEKALSDLLVSHRVVKDDRFCWALYIERTEGLDHCRVTVSERENVFEGAATP